MSTGRGSPSQLKETQTLNTCKHISGDVWAKPGNSLINKQIHDTGRNVSWPRLLSMTCATSICARQIAVIQHRSLGRRKPQNNKSSARQQTRETPWQQQEVLSLKSRPKNLISHTGIFKYLALVALCSVKSNPASLVHLNNHHLRRNGAHVSADSPSWSFMFGGNLVHVVIFRGNVTILQ